MEDIKSFKNLRVWQASYELGLAVYRHTKHFPKEEQFALISQMRRAVVSVSSNIAEGYGRRQPKDKEHFYTMACGSLYELQSQLEFSKGLGYLTDVQHSELSEQAVSCAKQLNALLSRHRS